MTGEYEEKKAAYDNLAAGLESNMSKLEQVIKILTHPSLRFKRKPFSLSFSCVHVRVVVAAHVSFARESRLTCSILYHFQEVRGLREELTHEEGRYHYLHCMLNVSIAVLTFSLQTEWYSSLSSAS